MSSKLIVVIILQYTQILTHYIIHLQLMWYCLSIIPKKKKDKERILKLAREKQLIMYKRFSTRLIADSSSETLKARRQWDDIFKVMKEKYCQSRILYKVKVSFKDKGDRNSLVVQWLGLCALTAKGPGSIPSWGTKIQHPTRCVVQNKKERKEKKERRRKKEREKKRRN